MTYINIILLSNLIIIVANALATPVQTIAAISELTGLSLLSTLSVIGVDSVTAFLVRRLPERWFAPPTMVMHVSERERRLYRRLGIKRWKERVPELGVFTGFHKDHVESTTDVGYLRRFLLELHYGVVIHAVNVVCGFAILLLPGYPPTVTLPVALVNALLTGAPIAVLRHNAPALQRLYDRATAKLPPEVNQ